LRTLNLGEAGGRGTAARPPGEWQWTSSETARSRPAKGRRTTSPARSASTRCSRRPIRRAIGASVTFEPGARTAWHTHPLGQTLVVTAGCGRAQREGGPVEDIRSGDVVWFPPGEKHWHGAAPTTAMTHIAIQEALNGKVVDWMEKVSDAQYRA
jgi:quercetin dioxygenase-like cupin family protein